MPPIKHGGIFRVLGSRIRTNSYENRTIYDKSVKSKKYVEIFGSINYTIFIVIIKTFQRQ